MTAIYQTHHLNLQLFMLLVPLRECLFVVNEIVAQGKQIYSCLKDMSSPEQMFHVNLFSSNIWVRKEELSFHLSALCVTLRELAVLADL